MSLFNRRPIATLAWTIHRSSFTGGGAPRHVWCESRSKRTSPALLRPRVPFVAFLGHDHGKRWMTTTIPTSPNNHNSDKDPHTSPKPFQHNKNAPFKVVDSDTGKLHYMPLGYNPDNHIHNLGLYLMKNGEVSPRDRNCARLIKAKLLRIIFGEDIEYRIDMLCKPELLVATLHNKAKKHQAMYQDDRQHDDDDENNSSTLNNNTPKSKLDALRAKRNDRQRQFEQSLKKVKKFG